MLFRRPFFLSLPRVPLSERPTLGPPFFPLRFPTTTPTTSTRPSASEPPGRFTDTVATHPGTRHPESLLASSSSYSSYAREKSVCAARKSQFLRAGYIRRWRTFVPTVSAKRGVIRGLPNARSLYVINNRSCKNACAIRNCGLLDCGLKPRPDLLIAGPD